jgi:hypothetical protein
MLYAHAKAKATIVAINPQWPNALASKSDRIDQAMAMYKPQ